MIIYVSPNGNDSHSGRQQAATAGRSDGPVASLEAAQRLVHQALAAEGSQAIEVHLLGGVYRLKQTLVLGPADSGTAEEPVTWRNAPSQTPVLSGGEPVTGWQLLEEDIDGLPPQARGHVYVAKLPPRMPRRVRALFDSAGMLTRAHTDGFKTADREGQTSRSCFCCEPGVLRNWPNLQDAELLILPTYTWLCNYLPLASVDVQAGVATTTIPGTYKLSARWAWGFDMGTARFENVAEGLSEPGRWMVDSSSGRIYLWPREGKEPAGIIAPRLTELVRVEGDFERSDWARNIVIEGLTFTHCDRLPWPADRRAAQHDWEICDAPDAAVRLRGAEQVAVSNCRFHDSGGSGVRLDLHATDCRVQSCEMARLGGSGVVLLGYGPGTRDENHHNEIDHNHVHHCGLLTWHAAGVFLYQSGHNHVHDNLVHNMPYTGIVLVSGREGAFAQNPLAPTEGGRQDSHDGRGNIDWGAVGQGPPDWFHRLGFLHCRHNLIEHNEVHGVMERLGDGNGIYLSGTGVGNIVRRNYVHDIVGAVCHSAIRLDDMQWHTRIEENVVCRIAHGGGITLKHINDMENNIVVDAGKYGAMLVRRSPSFGANLRRNIFVQPRAAIANGGTVAPFYYDGPGASVKEPTIDDNVLWCVEDPATAEKGLAAMRAIGKDTRSVAADPMFVDASRDDYRLRPDSPALELGIRSIDSWGLRGKAGPA